MNFKEKDIRDPNILKKYLSLVSKDSKAIVNKKNTFEIIDYKSWGLGTCKFEFEKSGYKYQKWLDTGSLFVNPRPKFDALNDFYANSESGSFWVRKFFKPKIESRREKIFKPRAKYVKNKFSNKLHKMIISDIGAGFGLFIEELCRNSHQNIDIEAIEPSDEMANICRDKNITVRQSMLENVNDKFVKYDLLTTFELFEHLQNPLIFLKDCFNLLNSEGYLYLTTLNSHGFDIQILWEESNSIFPPHHLNFFNPISMKNILEIVGFKNIEITTPGELDIDIVKNAYRKRSQNIPRFLSTIYDF